MLNEELHCPRSLLVQDKRFGGGNISFLYFVEPGRPGLGTRVGRRLPSSGVAPFSPRMGTPRGQLCDDLLQRIIPEDKRLRHVVAETTLGNGPRAKDTLNYFSE
jgi:hypothetical protein